MQTLLLIFFNHKNIESRQQKCTFGNQRHCNNSSNIYITHTTDQYQKIQSSCKNKLNTQNKSRNEEIEMEIKPTRSKKKSLQTANTILIAVI